MIEELKEGLYLVEKLISLNNSIFKNILHEFKNKKIIFTGMGSSFFISEFASYFFKRVSFKRCVYSYSSDELDNFIDLLDNSYFIFTFSQSGNTKEVLYLLEKLNLTNISYLTFINNLNSKQKNISKKFYYFDIGIEKSPVSTKYVIYAILFLYKLAFISNKNYINDLNILNKYGKNILDKYDLILEKILNKVDLNKNNNFLIIGNNIDYFIGKEISLKLREGIGLNSSYDNIGQLNHGGINSINSNTICILLTFNKDIINKIEKRGGTVITIGINNCDIHIKGINEYLDAVQKIIILQYLVYKISLKLNIDINIKLW